MCITRRVVSAGGGGGSGSGTHAVQRPRADGEANPAQDLRDDHEARDDGARGLQVGARDLAGRVGGGVRGGAVGPVAKNGVGIEAHRRCDHVRRRARPHNGRKHLQGRVTGNERPVGAGHLAEGQDSFHGRDAEDAGAGEEQRHHPAPETGVCGDMSGRGCHAAANDAAPVEHGVEGQSRNALHTQRDPRVPRLRPRRAPAVSKLLLGRAAHAGQPRRARRGGGLGQRPSGHLALLWAPYAEQRRQPVRPRAPVRPTKHRVTCSGACSWRQEWGGFHGPTAHSCVASSSGAPPAHARRHSAPLSHCNRRTRPVNSPCVSRRRCKTSLARAGASSSSPPSSSTSTSSYMPLPTGCPSRCSPSSPRSWVRAATARHARRLAASPHAPTATRRRGHRRIRLP